MKKHKFTWIDGLALAVVVLLIAGTCVKFLGKDTTAAQNETEKFSYELEIRGLRQVSVDAIAVGDTVYENAGKAQVGSIVDIAVTPAVTTIARSDGTVAEQEVEDRFDVVLTLEAEGIVDGNSHKIGVYDIMVNHGDTYYTKYSIWSATVRSIG